MTRYIVRLNSPFADAVRTVCRREAEIVDIRTGYPLVQRQEARQEGATFTALPNTWG